MKKGWKIFWIIIGCIGGLGLILTIISVLVGFSFRGTFQEFSKPGRDFVAKKSKHIEWIHEDLHDEYYNADYDDDYDENFSCTASSEELYEKIDSLTLNVALGEVSLLPSKDDKVHITSCKHVEPELLEITQDGSKLIVNLKTPPKKWRSHHKHSKLSIYLPKNTILKTLDISMKTGEIDAETIFVDHLNLDLNAGSCSLDGLKAKVVSANVDAGELDIEGIIEQDLTVDCSVGEVEVDLKDASTNYNYSVMCDAGTITIGEDTYTGLTTEKTYNNHSSKNINLNCTLGNIDLEFLQ